MNKSHLIRFFAVLLTAFLALTLGLSLRFWVRGVAHAPLAENVTGTDGGELAAVSILDLTACSAITTANYTPDEFLLPNVEISGTPVSFSDGHQEAERGTYIFVLLSPDPFSETFTEDAETLDRFLLGDSWQFTLHIPTVWTSCVVYIDDHVVARVGEISDYNFVEYSDYVGYTESHVSRSESLFLDLSFYARREAIPTDPLAAAQVVTIHFETNSSFSGISRPPVIGRDTLVRSTVTRDSSLLASFAAIAAVSVCLCLFFCVIKHTAEFVPEALVSLGIFGIMIFNFALAGQAALPALLQGLSLSAFSFIAAMALLPLGIRVKKFPVALPFIALGLCGCVAGLVTPYVSIPAAAVLNRFRSAATVIDAAVILVLALLCPRFSSCRLRKLLTPTVAGVTSLCGIYFTNTVLVLESAVFWLLAAVLLTAFFVNLGTFIEIERRNEYLTHNLATEVSRQTEDLSAVLDERNTILRFVSHDMKKPVISMEQFLYTLREREKDGEQIKTIDIVRRKNADLKNAFDELNKYAKNNYVAEQSAVFDVREAIDAAYESLSPDCEANGILLVREDEYPVYVYAKKMCLINVLNNLVMNAIEHAECTQIRLSAVRRRGRCLLAVSDNGKGIRAEDDPFAAYVTEGVNGENLGLGLYICRSLVGSMSGTLDYDYRDGNLTFTISLPIS